MELDREERRLNRPPNWGAIAYQTMLSPDGTDKFPTDKKLIKKLNQIQTLARSKADAGPPRHIVHLMLEDVAATTGVLDATKALTVLGDFDLCDFFGRHPLCQHLIMKNWITISPHVLRAITITFGENMTALDLSHSQVTAEHLDLILSKLTLHACVYCSILLLLLILCLVVMLCYYCYCYCYCYYRCFYNCHCY